MTVNSKNMPDSINEDSLPLDIGKCTPEEVEAIDSQKKLIYEIGYIILREKLEQHSAEEQLRLVGFDDELHDRVEDHISTIQNLTVKLKSAYQAFVTVGGDSDELSDLFDEFERCGLFIEQGEMFDEDED